MKWNRWWSWMGSTEDGPARRERGRYSRLVGVVVIALLLAACANDQGADGATTIPADVSPTLSDSTTSTGVDTSEPDEDTPQEPVELTMGLWGDFGYEALIEEYQSMNPHVTVTIQLSDFAAHHDALTTSLAAGSGSLDIAAVAVDYIGSYTLVPDRFVNIQDLGGNEVTDDYLDWRWDQGTSADGSATIGLPTDVGGMAVCYRTDLFEAAGLPVDRNDVSALWADSWADFIAVGEQYGAATGAAFIDSADVSLYNAVVNQSADTYYDQDGNVIYADSEQVRKAWDTSVSAVDSGIDAKLATFSTEWNAGLSSGAFAALMCPAWMMTLMQGQAPDTAGQWDLAALPEGGGNWGGSHLVIPAYTDHPQEAYDFIEWLLAPEQQLDVFTRLGNFPSTPALYDQPEIQGFTNEFFVDAPVGEIYAANAQEVVAQNTGPDFEAIDQEFQNGLGRVSDGTESSDEAWESTLANIANQIGE